VRGFSFVEVLIATAILAVAFVPIAGLIQQSFTQVSDQRMEAAVASYTAQVVNEWMFEKRYDVINDNCPGVVPLGDKQLADGVVVAVTIDLWEVDPEPGGTYNGNAVNRMTFEYYRIPYHPPCASAAEVNDYPVPPSDGALLRNKSSSAPVPYTYMIDSKYQGTDAKAPLITMRFTIKWRGRWESWPAAGSREDQLRTRYVVCRRANLE